MSKPEGEFTFDEKTHTYRLDGKRLTGVTTILGVIAKPALVPWAARMTCEYIEENSPSLEGVWAVSESVLKQARKAHTKKRDKAAEKGTDIHTQIEMWLKEDIEPKDSPHFQLFLDWAEKNMVALLESEKRMYHRKLFYAGTVDLIYRDRNNEIVLADIKTTSGIYDRTPFFQMAGYQHALNSMGLYPEITKRKVIRIGKDLTFEEKDSLDYETDLNGFLSALKLYRSLKTFKRK